MLLASVLFHFLATTPLFSRATGTSRSAPRPVIIDTDLYSDVDDVGALAIANVLHNCGLCDLRGIAINTPSKYGALAVSFEHLKNPLFILSLSVFRSSSLPPPTPLQASAINTYYNNPDIPISALQPFTDEIYVDDYSFLRSDYASKLATHFPNYNNTLQREEDDITIPVYSSTNETETETKSLETPLEMYTRLLESTTEDNSVTIISLGFLTNLATLLNTSSGYELVQSKVREIIIMGGTYPGPGWEFNFGEFPSATKTVLENFPPNVQVTFSGFELGADVFSGKGLKKQCDEEERDNSPIRAAYEWYVGRCSTLRESWDPITTLYGILGLKGLFINSPLNGEESSLFEYGNVGGGGYNKIVESNGTNLWIDDDGQQHNQRWLKLAEGVSNGTVAEILDGFYTHGPGGCELF